MGSSQSLKTSSDGSTWSSHQFSSVSNAYLFGLAFGNNTFVGVGYSGFVLTSSDNGTSWDNRTSGTTKTLKRVTFGNDTFRQWVWMEPSSLLRKMEPHGLLEHLEYHHILSVESPIKNNLHLILVSFHSQY